jgi:hypothetical protein
MSGLTQEFSMQITPSGIKQLVLLVALVAPSASTLAEVPLPTQINLASGDLVQQRDKRLFEVDAEKHKVSPIQVPPALRQALKTSSSIAFPADHSSLIDGNEYILVVVNQSSSSNPMGYCGVGEEGTLYALELHDRFAVPRFSQLVQSCLKDFDLASDSNQKSGYLAITWKDVPVGIQVNWDIYGDKADVSRFYKYQNGQFIEATQ